MPATSKPTGTSELAAIEQLLAKQGGGQAPESAEGVPTFEDIARIQKKKGAAPGAASAKVVPGMRTLRRYGLVAPDAGAAGMPGGQSRR